MFLIGGSGGGLGLKRGGCSKKWDPWGGLTLILKGIKGGSQAFILSEIGGHVFTR